MVKIKGIAFENDGIKGDKWENATAKIFENLGFSVKAEKTAGKSRAGSGKTDIKVIKNNGGYFSVDAKNSASVISYDNTKRNSIKGSSIVCYAPIIPDNAIIFNNDFTDFEIDFNKVEYFIIKKSDFIQAVKNSGLYKENFKATSGDKQIHIKTFYSNSQQKIMSQKKYDALVNALYEMDITTEIENW